MKHAQQLNAIFKEDESIKTFIRDDFTYIYDKETNTTISWGKSKDETPSYNPVCPERIYFHLNKQFIFDKSQLLKLIGLKVDNENLVTLLSEVYFIIDGEIDLLIAPEILKLFNYFNEYKIYTSFVIKNNFDIISIKDIINLKQHKINNVEFWFDDIKNSSLIIKKFLQHSINVSCKFIIDNLDKYNALINELQYIPNLLKILIQINKVDESSIENLSEILNKGGFNDTFIENSYKQIGMTNKIKTIDYECGLFSCYFNFIDNTIAPSIEKSTNIKIKNINTINDYWNSTQFKRFRTSLFKIRDKNKEKLKDLSDTTVVNED